MPYGLPWSEKFIRDLSDKEIRDAFVADQMRLRIAMLIRALRGQPDRDWSQTKLGQEMGKPQSVVSRIEDPDYGKLSLQTLLDVAAAFDVPLWVDIPEWEDWFRLIKNVPNSTTCRRSFNIARLREKARAAKEGTGTRNIVNLFSEIHAGDKWNSESKTDIMEPEISALVA
jgi:hypothetical protein